MNWSRNGRLLQALFYKDWGLMLIALALATVFWWDVKENRYVSRYFPDIEVRFTNLDPTLRVASNLKTPSVSIRVTGPKILQDLDKSNFLMRADLSQIHDATHHVLFLAPKGFSSIQPGLSTDDLRVRQEDIYPSQIELQTEWNSRVAKVMPRYSPKPALGYVISATWVSPATLTIAGSDAELARHAVVRNRNELVIDGETETKEQVWTLDDLDLGNLKVIDDPEPVIRFKIFIEPFFRKRSVDQVPIQISGKPEGTTEAIVTPTNVDLVIQGARLKVNSVASESVALDLDVSNIPPGQHTYTTMNLTPINLPEDVQIIEATPSLIHVDVRPTNALFHELWKNFRDSYINSREALSATETYQQGPLLPSNSEINQATPDQMRKENQ